MAELNWFGKRIERSRLGLHGILPHRIPAYDSKICEAVPAVLKWVGDGSDLLILRDFANCLGNSTILLARPYSSGRRAGEAAARNDNPEEAARIWWRQNEGLMRQLPTSYFEAVNELGREYTGWLGRFDKERVRLAKAAGLRVACGGWSVGTPDIRTYPAPERPQNDDWPAYYPAFQAISDAGPDTAVLHCHEYAYKGLSFTAQPYHVGRINAVYHDHIVPHGWTIFTVVSEGGRDSDPYKKLGMNAEQYLGELLDRQFDSLYHPNVLGYAIYTLDEEPGWEDFRIQGPVADGLLAYLRAHRPAIVELPPPAPPSVPPMTDRNQVIPIAGVKYLRSGPGLKYRVISTVAPQEALLVLEDEGLLNVGQPYSWVHVQMASGQLGWIAGWIIKRKV